MTKRHGLAATCGAAAAVLVSEFCSKTRGLDTSVYIAAQAMTTDKPGTFDSGEVPPGGLRHEQASAAKVYRKGKSGLGPDDLDVVEFTDRCQNELITYEALGLCPEGGADKLNHGGYGAKSSPILPGGLLSKGHPLGATGLAQCFELEHQLARHGGRTSGRWRKSACNSWAWAALAWSPCTALVRQKKEETCTINQPGSRCWNLQVFAMHVVHCHRDHPASRGLEEQTACRPLGTRAGRAGVFCWLTSRTITVDRAVDCHQCVVFEELSSAGDSSFGLHVHAIVAHYLHNQGTAAQKVKYLPLLASGAMVVDHVVEPGAGLT